MSYLVTIAFDSHQTAAKTCVRDTRTATEKQTVWGGGG